MSGRQESKLTARLSIPSARISVSLILIDNLYDRLQFFFHQRVRDRPVRFLKLKRLIYVRPSVNQFLVDYSKPRNVIILWS